MKSVDVSKLHEDLTTVLRKHGFELEALRDLRVDFFWDGDRLMAHSLNFSPYTLWQTAMTEAIAAKK